MPGGAIQKANLGPEDRKNLVEDLGKRKIYPITYKWNKLITAITFPNVDVGGVGNYFTMSFTPRELTGIISIAAGYIVTPNTNVDIFNVVCSYKSVLSMGDITNLNAPNDEGGDIYQLLSNGASINDFQVFFPLNWYVARNQSFFIHVFAGAASLGGGTTIRGRVTLGCLTTGS